MHGSFDLDLLSRLLDTHIVVFNVKLSSTFIDCVTESLSAFTHLVMLHLVRLCILRIGSLMVVFVCVYYPSRFVHERELVVTFRVRILLSGVVHFIERVGCPR